MSDTVTPTPSTSTPPDPPTLTVVAIDPAMVLADHRLLVAIGMGLTVLLDLHPATGRVEAVRQEAMTNLAQHLEPWLPRRGEGRES